MTIGCRLCLLRVFQVLHTHGSTPGAFALCRSSIRNPSTPVTSDQSQPHHTAVWDPRASRAPRALPSRQHGSLYGSQPAIPQRRQQRGRVLLPVLPRTGWRAPCPRSATPASAVAAPQAAARSSTQQHHRAVLSVGRSVARTRLPRTRRQATGGATSRAHSIGRHARVDETPLEPEPVTVDKKRKRRIYPFIPS